METERGDERLGEEWRYDHHWLDADKAFIAWLEFVDQQGKEHADRDRNEERSVEEWKA